MANCRIQNIVPLCAYNVEGITDIYLLDYDDFRGYKFDGDNLYNNCLVTAVMRAGNFTTISAPDVFAKYSAPQQGNLYGHSLETFVSDLTAETLANLHLASKRRQVVVFKAKAGRYYTFGYEAGAQLSYTNQTADVLGSLVTISAASIYPLFEATAEAITAAITTSTFVVDFDNQTYCIDG